MERTAQCLLADRQAHEPFLRDGHRTVTVGEFIAKVSEAASRLEGKREAINLCQTRLGFLVGYAAAVVAGCTTLMPPSRAREAVAAVRAEFPGCCLFDDEDVTGEGAVSATLAVPGDDRASGWPVMIGFTSGTTGRPTGHRKYWATVCESTRLSAAVIRAAIPTGMRNSQPWIVGTVPSQHMYGMELTVLLPLLSQMGLHAGSPLLPAEVAAALEQAPAPRVLVSTPAHLRAIVQSGVRLPRVEVIVSATAPLDADLARLVEAATGGCLLDMFGSTETCIIGHREPARATRWQAYPGVSFTAVDGGTLVATPWFRAPQMLLDLIEATPDGSFVLQGRSVDLIDVAGKRASLADLTKRILSVPGVVDAIAFQPQVGRGLVRRVAALVVAPTLTPAGLRSALEPAIDPVFMPRPLVFVTALPRTPAGKLPRRDVEAALAAAGVRDGPSG